VESICVEGGFKTSCIYLQKREILNSCFFACHYQIISITWFYPVQYSISVLSKAVRPNFQNLSIYVGLFFYPYQPDLSVFLRKMLGNWYGPVGTRFSILGTRIRSQKHLKKPGFINVRLVKLRLTCCNRKRGTSMLNRYHIGVCQRIRTTCLVQIKNINISVPDRKKYMSTFGFRPTFTEVITFWNCCVTGDLPIAWYNYLRTNYATFSSAVSTDKLLNGYVVGKYYARTEGTLSGVTY